jgi:hypothetical protein
MPQNLRARSKCGEPGYVRASFARSVLAGYPSDQTDGLVQSNVVAAGYKP